MALKSKIKVKVGDTGEILYIDLDREWILNKDGVFLMEIPKTADAIKIIRYLCSQYQNYDNGIVTNEMILKYLYMNDPVITKMHITKNMSKIRKIYIWNTGYTFADFIWSNNTGRFKILLAESPFDESSQCSTEMSDYAKYINETKLPSKLDDVENIFSFRFTGIEFKGRKDELNRLYSWLMQEHVSVWAVTGKGGSGKSRLALHIAQQLEERNIGKAVWIDSDILEALNKYNDYSYPKPVLFICDYAARYDDKLSKLIDKMSRTQTNAKFLLIERSDSWYNGFLRKNDGVKERAIKEPIILDNLDFSPEEYAEIMKDFSDALYGKDTKQIPEPAQQQIIQKAKELSGKENAARCLFLLLVTDAYLEDENADIRHLNAQNLLHNYLERFCKIWKPEYEGKTIKVGCQILAYATACDGIPFSEMNNHPAIINKWDTIQNQFNGRQEINQYFQRICEIDELDTVPAVKPDLIGEFLFLNEWQDLKTDDEQTNWLSNLLKEDYSRFFIAMCLVDWAEEAERLCEMLSDCNANSEIRAYCAKVFNRVVREMESEEERKEYAAKIKALDHDHSPAVLKEYTVAVRSIFELAAKETRAECTALLNEVDWAHYHCTSEEKQQHYADACSYAASVYLDKGDYDKALEFNQKALAIREKVLGTEHPDTACAYNNIAAVYQVKGEYDKAVKLYKKSLTISEKMPDTEHAMSFATHFNIIGLYTIMGKYDKALNYCEKIRTTFEEELDTENPYSAKYYHTLAFVYYSKGDYGNALAYNNEALKIREKVFGTEHLEAASSYNNIASAYYAKGDYDKALAYFEKALTIREKVLGTEHPDTATTYSNIAKIYNKCMRNYSKALTYYQKAIKINEKVFGTEHPNTAILYDNIAEVYRLKSDYDIALKFYQDALAISEKVFGTEHPFFATTYNNIACVYKDMGEFDKALKTLQDALAIYEKVLGTEHPDTATTYNNIAGVYQLKGDYDMALRFYRDALAIREKVLGTEHPDTVTTYNSIAVVYQLKGDYDIALKFYRNALAIREKVLGTEHPDTATTYNNIAGVYQLKGDYDMALKFYRDTLAIYEKALGTEHPDTATTYNNIAVVYQLKGEYDMALTFYQKDLAISEKNLGTKHPENATTYHNIASIYFDEHKYKMALEYEHKAERISEAVFGPEHPKTQLIYRIFATYYLENENTNKAREYIKKLKNPSR